MYMEATNCYFFINLTQECEPRVKFHSDLFNEFVIVYIVDRSTFNTVKANNETGRIHFLNEPNQNLKQFHPNVGGIHMNQYGWYNPMNKSQHSLIVITYNVLWFNSKPSKYNVTIANTNFNIHQMTNRNVKTDRDNIGINTNQDTST